MMEILGSSPIEEEIPYSREDLTLQTQWVLNLYDLLPDRWEGMSGTYLGKDLNLLPVLFSEFNAEKHDRMYAWKIIPVIDNFVSQDVAAKVKAKKGTPTSGHS
jgi:hypothetical protein